MFTEQVRIPWRPHVAEIAVIQLQSLAFGPFAEAEPLNPRFVPGHPKLKLTVDADRNPPIDGRRLLEELTAAFPGLSRHQCQVGAGRAGATAEATGIAILDGDPAANEAHLLEHLILEMLSAVGRVPRLSGVTCAYETPVERNDIFVECERMPLGEFVSRLAIRALNATLSGSEIAPLYGDATIAAGVVWDAGAGVRWTPAETARKTGLPPRRAEAALRVLRELDLLEEEELTMNFSGEPVYRPAGRSGVVVPSSGTPGA